MIILALRGLNAKSLHIKLNETPFLKWRSYVRGTLFIIQFNSHVFLLSSFQVNSIYQPWKSLERVRVAKNLSFFVTPVEIHADPVLKLTVDSLNF